MKSKAVCHMEEKTNKHVRGFVKVLLGVGDMCQRMLTLCPLKTRRRMHTPPCHLGSTCKCKQRNSSRMAYISPHRKVCSWQTSCFHPMKTQRDSKVKGTLTFTVLQVGSRRKHPHQLSKRTEIIMAEIKFVCSMFYSTVFIRQL